MSFNAVDEPATDALINRWWSRQGVHLIGFTAGMAHWVAVATDVAGRVKLYLLCGTTNDVLPWERMPSADVNCMTCLAYAARPTWKEPN